MPLPRPLCRPLLLRLPAPPLRVEYQNLFKCQARCTLPLQLKLSSGSRHWRSRRRRRRRERRRRRWSRRRRRGNPWGMKIDNPLPRICDAWRRVAWSKGRHGHRHALTPPPVPLPPPLCLSPCPASFMGKMSYEFCCSNLKAVIKTNFICFSFRRTPAIYCPYQLLLPCSLPPAPPPSPRPATVQHRLTN